MILLIDNYDSFAYNLYQQAAAIRPDIRVVRNDAVTAGAVEQMQPSHILLSPGPGYPKDAGVCEDVIRRLGGRIPILGVCLGHQAICEVFGARIVHAKRLMHGKQSTVTLDPDDPLFRGLEGQVTVARYHSLVAEPGHPAGLPCRDRARWERRDHGRAAQNAARLRGAVPSGIHPDPAGRYDTEKFPIHPLS